MITAWEQLWINLEEEYKNDLNINNISLEPDGIDITVSPDDIQLLSMLLYAWQKYGSNKTFDNWLSDIVEGIDLSKTILTESSDHPMWKVWNRFTSRTFV